MKKIFTIILLINILYFNSFSQNNLCNLSDPFCTGTTYNMPAPVNAGDAETGPDYGCLFSQPNPVWFYLLIDQPGNLVLDIHSSTSVDLDYICWGPFTSQTAPCNAGLTYAKIVDCNYNYSTQDWCNIPNTLTNQYYILLITNSSNQATNIILSQSNSGQTGSGNTNCSTCTCYFDNINYTINPCNPVTNKYLVSGNLIFHFAPASYTMTGNIIVSDQPNNTQIVLPGPFNNSSSPLPFTLYGINSDGLQHTLTATFTDTPNNTFTITYTAPDTCTVCTINAGTNLQFCGLSGLLNAVENITDVNTHWLPTTGVSFSNINSPNSTVTVNTYGTYNLVWQITDSNELLCTDTVTVEFIDPSLCTSLPEKSLTESFSIFPNPASNGKFEINYSSNYFDDITIRIISIEGKDIFKSQLTKNTEFIKIPVDIGNNNKGYYIVELISGQNVCRKSILIQ